MKGQDLLQKNMDNSLGLIFRFSELNLISKLQLFTCMKQKNPKAPLFAALTSLIGLTGTTSAALLVYEPFDYDQTEPINNGGAFLGDGSQTGALGLGTWSQRSQGPLGTPAAPPTNEADVSDGGLSFTDAGGNTLPSTGNAWVRRTRQGQIATSSPVVTSGFSADNSTLWMTFLYQDLGFSGPDFGIGLSSENMIGNDNQSLTAAGVGVGFGINSVGGPARGIGALYYDNATEFTRVTEETATFNGPAASDLFLLAMKVEWNPDGVDDVISVYNVTDLTTEPTNPLATATVDLSQAEQDSLDVLNISETQVAFVDEVRIATTFGEAVGGSSIPEPSSLILGAMAGLLALGRRQR